MELTWVLGGLAGASPQLAMWIVAVVLSYVLLRRSGGSPERFLVIGSILMLVNTLVSALGSAVVDYVGQDGSSVGATLSLVFWTSRLVAAPGIICLFFGVWKKFNEKIGVEDGSASMRAKSRDISS